MCTSLLNIAHIWPSLKKGLIAGKYMCSLNNMYLKFSIRYYNSVTFIKLSINFYISGKSYARLHKSYEISNLEIMVKIWRTISPKFSIEDGTNIIQCSYHLHYYLFLYVYSDVEVVCGESNCRKGSKTTSYDQWRSSRSDARKSFRCSA